MSRVVLCLLGLFMALITLVSAFPSLFGEDLSSIDLFSVPRFVSDFVNSVASVGRSVLDNSFKFVKPVFDLLDGDISHIEFIDVGVRSIPIIGSAYDLIYNGIGEIVSWLDSIFDF